MIPPRIPDPELRRELFYRLLRIRLVEQEIARRYAEQDMRCPVHLSVGQEGAAVGACAPLIDGDVVMTTHRCHGHYLAKGGSLPAMIAELHGRKTGCCGGRGGSMHLFDDEAGVMASVPIVGSNIPLAVGAGLAFAQRESDSVAVAFLGDAAVEEGVFHESLNFASTHRIPVVFFVENNLYSVYTRLDERQPGLVPDRLALAHEVPFAHADGNDVEAVYTTMHDAVGRARRGGGPTLIAVDTYRWLEHCGPNSDDDLDYRPADEVEAWKRRCPVATFEARLRQVGELNDDVIARLREKIVAEVDDAFERARNAPFPDPATLGDHVYAASPTVAQLEVVS